MPPPPINQKMASLLTRRKSLSSHRILTTFPSSSIDFSSNDFLSLSTSSLFRSAYLSELNNYPEKDFRIGSGGSRLLDGNSRYAEELEGMIADFHGSEAALLFNSGFDANEGFFGCVMGRDDVIIFDEKVHASVREGIKLSLATTHLSFSHNSISSLQKLLIQVKTADVAIKEGRKNVFVAVESLYSMDGDLAPLQEIVDVVEEVLENGNGLIVVDEAHSTGVYGRNGRGLVSALGLENRVFARLHTFGKALGCNGAAILCSKLTREYLINYAKPLIYTTAMGFPSLAAIKVVYSLMKAGKTDSLRQNLTSLISLTHAQLQTLQPLIPPIPLPLSHSTEVPLLIIPRQQPKSPIFSLQTPNPRSLAKYCQENALVVRAIMPPTVPVGTQRVRVCLHAGNKERDVERLVRVVGEWLVLQGKVEGEREENVGNVGREVKDERVREVFVKAVL